MFEEKIIRWFNYAFFKFHFALLFKSLSIYSRFRLLFQVKDLFIKENRLEMKLIDIDFVIISSY